MANMASRSGGVFGDRLEKALKYQAKMPLRSDQFDTHVSFRDLAADDGGLDELNTSNWQVVFGRRGTGKTHLLRSFSEMINASYRNTRKWAVYLSASDFTVSDQKLSDHARVRAYFQIFLDELTVRMLHAVDAFLRDMSFMTAISGSRRRKQDKIETLALELRELVNDGTVIPAFSKLDETTKETSGQSHKRSLSLGAEAALKGSEHGLGGAASLAFGAKVGATADRMIHETKIRTPARSLRGDLVRQKLTELIECAGVRCLFILIDEWPQIDPTGELSIQPEFANLLRRCLGNSQRISVKIASNRYQTRLSYDVRGRGRVGLELNADIFEAVNLDQALLNEKELKSFYECMIFKRLCYVEPILKDKFGAPRDAEADGTEISRLPLSRVRPVAGFIEQIFHDAASFIELIKGCEGIPREFIVLFNSTSRKSEYSVKKRWKIPFIQTVIREKSVMAQTAEIEYNSRAYGLLNGSIRETVLRNLVRTVGFPKMNGDLAQTINELLEKRILHEFPRNQIPNNFRHDDVDFYLVDYGYCLDWVRSFESNPAKDGVAQLSNLNFSNPLQVENAMVSVPDLTKSPMLCPSCQVSFPSDAKSYVARRLCPECFELVDAPVGSTMEHAPRDAIETLSVRKRASTPRPRKVAVVD